MTIRPLVKANPFLLICIHMLAFWVKHWALKSLNTDFGTKTDFKMQNITTLIQSFKHGQNVKCVAITHAEVLRD